MKELLARTPETPVSAQRFSRGRSARCACLASIMFVAGFAAPGGVRAAPCGATGGICEVTVDGSRIVVDPDQPRVANDGFGFRTKFEEVGGFLLERSGGLTTWEVNGRDLMFSESVWYRIGPANVAMPASNPERYWRDPTEPLTGEVTVFPNGVGNIALKDPLPTADGLRFEIDYFLRDKPGPYGESLISERIKVTNTNPTPLADVSVFVYTDLDVEQNPYADDTARVQDPGGLNEIRQFDSAENRVIVRPMFATLQGTGLSVEPSFGLGYFGGRIISTPPIILDKLNNADDIADFDNQIPVASSPGDLTHVFQYEFDSIPAGGSAVITLEKIFTINLIEIEDTATGSRTPTVGPIGGVVQNGDFTITDIGGTMNTGTGDGIDEQTTWSFDFSLDPDLAALLRSLNPLVVADLVLELTPRDILVSTDELKIVGLDFFDVPDLPILDVGQVIRVAFDLLDFYTSDEIRSVLRANGGMIPMLYGDDAIVSFASLRLAVVPQPAAIVFAVPGLLVTFWAAKRRRAGGRHCIDKRHA